MNLNDLYPRGTKLIREDGTTDVSPGFRGMPPEEHRRLTVFQMIKAHAEAQPKIDPADAPLSKKAIATPRDNYGYRSSGR